MAGAIGPAEWVRLGKKLADSERRFAKRHGAAMLETVREWLRTRPDVEAWAIGQPKPWPAAHAKYQREAPVLTFTMSIARNGDVTNDTQSHGSSFAEVYAAFHAIKAEVDRQIRERRACPYNPRYGCQAPPQPAPREREGV